MNITETVIKVLTETELSLRNEMIKKAEVGDYSGITYDPKFNIMGESLRHGLNSRWLNVMRLNGLLKTGAIDYLGVCQELSHWDMETLKLIHKAMPA